MASLTTRSSNGPEKVTGGGMESWNETDDHEMESPGKVESSYHGSVLRLRAEEEGPKVVTSDEKRGSINMLLFLGGISVKD